MRRAGPAVAIAALGLAGSAAAAVLPAVLPMDTRVYKDESSQGLAIRFAGRVPATAGGDRVVMLVRDCMSRHFRQIGGTRTTAGGAWEMTAGGGYGFEFAPSGSTYQARWKGRPTTPFTWRTRVHPFVARASGARFRVTVSLGFGAPLQNLSGRTAMVQRLSGGTYVTVRTVRLRLVDARNFSATFAVPTRGLTLRVLVPTKSARPCYNAGASNIFTS